MASRQGRSNRIYNWHAAPWQIDARITIGSSGAPTLVTSSTIPGSSPSATTMQSQGVKSITRLTTGIYQVQLDDNFTSLLSFDAKFTAGLGSVVNMGSLATGTVYQIVTLGTSTQAQFVTAGVPAGITAAPGVVFKAAGAGAGNGTVKPLVGNTAGRTELYGTPDLMLNNQPFTQGNGGGYITFACFAHTPVGTVAAPTFTGTPATLTGTNSAPTFTGSALGNHTHNLTLKNAAVVDGATTRVNAGSNLLGANTGSDITITGAGANGGIANASAGTPAGTVSAPTLTMDPYTPAGTNSAPAFTGTTPIAADPTSGSTMYLRFLLSNSSVG